MKAAVVREHGGPDRLNFEPNFPDPKPGEGDVIVAVKASSLNYHDVFTRRGMPGISIAMPMIMGLDIAGEIDELGPGVAGWAIGDRVLVDPIDRARGGLMGETVHGGLAERCRVSAAQLIRVPDRVSFEEAGVIDPARNRSRCRKLGNRYCASPKEIEVETPLPVIRRGRPES